MEVRQTSEVAYWNERAVKEQMCEEISKNQGWGEACYILRAGEGATSARGVFHDTSRYSSLSRSVTWGRILFMGLEVPNVLLSYP